jgi:hypothetical protein
VTNATGGRPDRRVVIADNNRRTLMRDWRLSRVGKIVILTVILLIVGVFGGYFWLSQHCCAFR